MTNFSNESHRVCLAPMLDYTDKHFRFLLRLITKQTFFYSEMVTTGAILFGDYHRYLDFSSQEQPLALQLAGSDPRALAKACQLANQYHYNEINLNVGCPSPRVASAQFGAILMENPQLVADCMAAMLDSSDAPVSIKTRIGIEHNDDKQQLYTLVEAVAKVGVTSFIIHARKAWLEGLSPKENRDIPPLRYDMVYQLKKDFPQLKIIINGGITTHQQISEHLKYVDGVMVGREAYHNCYFMHEIDALFYPHKKPSDMLTRKEILQLYCDYIEQELHKGVPFAHMAKHTLGLFHACKGARLYRQKLSENIHKKGCGVELLQEAMNLVE